MWSSPENGRGRGPSHDRFRVTRGHCRPKAAYVANETRIDTQDALECIVPVIAGYSTEPKHLDRGVGVRRQVAHQAARSNRSTPVLKGLLRVIRFPPAL